MSHGNAIRVHKELTLPQSCMVVGWNEDAANLGRKVTDYLKLKLNGQEFAEIDPEEFFPMGGVAIKDNIARFPQSKFYVCPEQELMIFQSDSPSAEWYKFLTSILEVAEHHYRNLRELYVVGAMISFSAHTAPRELLAVSNLPEMKENLNQYNLNTDMDYQTAPGERPTLNSFLLWIAKEKNVPAASLWLPVPFYLAAVEDAQAQKKVLSFLDERLDLKIDFADLDQEIREQNEKLAAARSQFPQIDEYINRLESNLMLSEEENAELVKYIEDFLKGEN